MNKILGIIIAAATAGFLATPVYADDVEVDCETNPSSEACIMLLDEADTATPYVEYNSSKQDQETPTSNTTTAPKPTDYPDQTDDVEIIEEDVEVETEPVMWPVYLSFGALGAAILVFIILNLFSEKKK